MATGALLEARGVSRVFHQRRWGRTETVQALADVDLQVQQGETLALAGESGGGKTTLARILLGLLPQSAGEVAFDGLPLPFRNLSDASMFRSRVQLISQDAQAALDPGMTVGDAIAEGYAVQHPRMSRSRRMELVGHLLDELGLPAAYATRPPGALSGGEKRRIVIARAFAALGYGCPEDGRSRVMIADEPTAGLDAVVRAQVLQFFETQRQTMGISYLLISHDLEIVEKIADRVAILYGGRIVEIGSAAAVLGAPRHPYTRQLLFSRQLDREVEISEGDLEGIAQRGCAFRAGCQDPRKDLRCEEEPPMQPVGEQLARCWYAAPGQKQSS